MKNKNNLPSCIPELRYHLFPGDGSCPHRSMKLNTPHFFIAVANCGIHKGQRRDLKSKDITLLTKVHVVKAMVFPVVMSDCESWTIKKAECQRIDAFELWCWRRLLKVFGQQGDQTSQS